jgi:SIR2-like domain
MLLVILGAGASYDSIPTYPPGTGDVRANEEFRPPLADQLFANRLDFATAAERYRECLPVVPRLRELRGESVEAVLFDLQRKAVHYPRGQQQLAAVKYYLQEIIWDCTRKWKSIAKGVSNYKTLLDLIERTEFGNMGAVSLVTFNYDTLLEDALSEFGLPITTLADYTEKHQFYRLYKLHGSVNWARALDNKISGPNTHDTHLVAREWIQRAAELKITDVYHLVEVLPASVARGISFFPAIAIPVEKGKTFECPEARIKQLTAVLPDVTAVLVIGWRGAEEHFLDILKAHLATGVRMHIVTKGLKDAEDTRVRICTALVKNPPATVTLSDEGFTDFILSGKAEKFLNASP